MLKNFSVKKSKKTVLNILVLKNFSVKKSKKTVLNILVLKNSKNVKKILVLTIQKFVLKIVQK